MIFLSKKSKRFLKSIFVFSVCTLLFCAISYFYLNYNINKTKTDADIKDYTVPYKQKPNNCSVSFVLPEEDAIMLYLDFENTQIRVLNISDFESNSEYYGYTVDYTVQLNYELMSNLIDRVGGVNLKIGEEPLRYTGVQIKQLLEYGYADDIKNTLTKEVFAQIGKNGITTADFIYLLENSENNLSITDCIYWYDYIGDMCKNINYVN